MIKTSQLNKIDLLYNELIRAGIVGKILKMSSYPDEPFMHRFGTHLKNIQDYTDGNNVDTSASGFSFESPSLALLKCLMEAGERFATMKYRQTELIYSSYNDLNENSLSPALYTNNNKTLKKSLGWVRGFDINNNERLLIPAQAVYYNYKHQSEEPHLTVHISTGAAAGFDHNTTLLRGLYEIIERDAFMSYYLIRVSPPRIDLDTINSREIRNFTRRFKESNLELAVLDITNDLQIPVYLAIVVDRTGLGPGVSLGLKSSFDREHAIIGCIQEALQIRIWMRNELAKEKRNSFTLHPKDINTIKDRGFFWMPPSMIRHLGFFLNRIPQPIKLPGLEMNAADELARLKKIFNQKSIETAYADITPPSFRDQGCFIYRAVIPELQPLYFKESRPEIRRQRINEVANFFEIKNPELNKIPHPLL